MPEVTIRPVTRDDLPRMNEIYNHYIINTPITFETEPVTVGTESRLKWFTEHTAGKRYRMFVAEDAGTIAGYACTGPFRERAAYITSVEATIYLAHDVKRRGIGTALYRVLFDAVKNEDINRLVAGITLPNEASVAIHRKFGFEPVGVFSENGRKFDKYWDVAWMERPLRLRGE
jgi:phosphinothricin acetyltransferase